MEFLIVLANSMALEILFLEWYHYDNFKALIGRENSSSEHFLMSSTITASTPPEAKYARYTF